MVADLPIWCQKSCFSSTNVALPPGTLELPAQMVALCACQPILDAHQSRYSGDGAGLEEDQGRDWAGQVMVQGRISSVHAETLCMPFPVWTQCQSPLGLMPAKVLVYI